MSERIEENGIIRPGSKEVSDKKLSAMSPEIQRLDAIKYLMGPPDSATLSRISKEQIILEAVLTGAAELGYKIPATLYMINQARGLSPGLDGLGRGEAVKCLVAHAQSGSMFPASAFAQEEKPGLIARLVAFMSGKKQQSSGGT
jgi:hypothetical protein